MKEIKLTQGKVALIDDEDYEIINQFRWHAFNHHSTCYARTSVKKNRVQKNYLMHRVILGCPDGVQIDHINGDGLDNRRENLRECTQSQNCGNQRHTVGTSKYKGVCWHKRDKYWQAKIGIDNKTIALGEYKIEKDAARAYDKAALKYFGEFACTNQMMGLLK